MIGHLIGTKMPEQSENARIQELAAEIHRLKEELDEKRKEIRDLKELAGTAIDREFPCDLREFSERELGDYFRDALVPLNEVVDPRPDPKSVQSRGGILGGPIGFFKRVFLRMTGFYVHLLLDDQTRFNQRSASLTEALVVRIGHYGERLELAEQKVAAFEESLVILKSRLDDLGSRLDGLSAAKSSPPPR
jgi:hypothetical protein